MSVIYKNGVKYGGLARADIPIVQTTGQSTTNVMSQKAVTDELNNKQAQLSGAQLDAVNSGVDSTKVAKYESYETGKLSISNGIENASKNVVTDENGNITFVNGDIPKENVCYGFAINQTESDPKSAVYYLEDAVGMTPAYMDYTNSIFNYGSWEHAFFIPRPCMLKYDGTVDYYLNPNDYTLKEDGTASDITDTSYEGNAMMEWGQNGKKIWYKVVPNSSGCNVYIANYQKDSDFKCWNFYGRNNNLNDHFYTRIYRGSYDNTRLRSLSGKSIMNGQTASTEMTRAQANGSGWNIAVMCDRMLIDFLLILMGKSLNTQQVFGTGHHSGGSSASSLLTTGLLNGKGMFWGDQNNSGCKVFGMESWYAEQWDRLAGWINNKGTHYVKLTEGTIDGSSVTGYNTDGTGYINTGVAVPSASESYIKNMAFSNNCLLPTVVGGSSTTYYADGMWSNNGQIDFAGVGGSSYDGAFCGAFAVLLSNAASDARWTSGACLSFKHS